MDIRLGCRMIIEFSRQERMNCRFVGMSHNEFLLLRVPLNPGIRERIAEGMVLQFRYLNGGRIMSFQADVLRYQASPSSVVFISYPQTVHEHNLRKEKRFECDMPTELKAGSKTVSGHIKDINHSGCKFVSKKGEELSVELETSVSGSYETLEGAKCYNFSGVVKLVERENGHQMLGIKFDSDVVFPDKLNTLINECCVLPEEQSDSDS